MAMIGIDEAKIIVDDMSQLSIEQTDKYLRNADDSITYGIADMLEIDFTRIQLKGYVVHLILQKIYGWRKADAFATKRQASIDGKTAPLKHVTTEEIIDHLSQLSVKSAHDYLQNMKDNHLFSDISDSLAVNWDAPYHGTIHEIMYHIFGQKIQDFYDNTDKLTLTPKSEIPRKKDGIMRSDSDIKTTATVNGLMELDPESARKFLNTSKVRDTMLHDIAKEVGAKWAPSEPITIDRIIDSMYNMRKAYSFDCDSNIVVATTKNKDGGYNTTIDGEFSNDNVIQRVDEKFESEDYGDINRRVEKVIANQFHDFAKKVIIHANRS